MTCADGQRPPCNAMVYMLQASLPRKRICHGTAASLADWNPAVQPALS
jgi:hypothetical protein